MEFKEKNVEFVIGSTNVKLETGKMARQANGSVILTAGRTVLMATAVMSKEPKEGIDFLPLTIEVSEKMYAAGKIPGGFFKREARPSTDATLLARLIDRPLRPSFPKDFHNDVQIIITVLSFDPSMPYEPLAGLAASAALSISDIPFNGPIGSVQVGRVDGNFVVNPTFEELEKSDMDLMVAGSHDAILMVEADAKEVSEEVIVDALFFGHQEIKKMIEAQKKLVQDAGKDKAALPEPNAELDVYKEKINQFLAQKIEDSLIGRDKKEVETLLADIEKSVREEFISEDKDNEAIVLSVYNKLKKEKIRTLIITKKIRVDGRKPDEIRPIHVDVSVLPAVHGSALFTRGETQSLGVVTLGTADDMQLLDGLKDVKKSNYFFHYNFPPYSVGETGRISTGRRELGHGALAERSLKHILPNMKEYPYTIRIVSEILESNGSSSMASVCSGSLSLMDSGVPIKAPVAGIAMGLLMDGNDFIVLTDIQGLEDHYGDMDFKVAGTKEGITALQLDIKIDGLSKEILTQALAQAKQARFQILDIMNQTLSQSRDVISPNAPRIHVMFIPPDKVGALIGSGGKTIRAIEEESGATVVVIDGTKGEVNVSSKNSDELDKAIQLVTAITKDPEEGEEFKGKVVKIVNFGAFIEICPGKEGLLHISKIAKERVENVEDFLSMGDEVNVKIEKIDNQNRINLLRVFD